MPCKGKPQNDSGKYRKPILETEWGESGNGRFDVAFDSGLQNSCDDSGSAISRHFHHDGAQESLYGVRANAHPLRNLLSVKPAHQVLHGLNFSLRQTETLGQIGEVDAWLFVSL